MADLIALGFIILFFALSLGFIRLISKLEK
jgi:hypothetical protein